MSKDQTIGEALRARGISRRGFMKFCAATASMMALPPSMAVRCAAILKWNGLRLLVRHRKCQIGSANDQSRRRGNPP